MQSLPIFQNIAFNPSNIEQYVPMEPMHPTVFDEFCNDGWCYWSDLLFRRNHWEWRGHPCRVIILRIQLKDFTISKSQRKILRNNQDLQTVARPIRISAQHEELFLKHSVRFEQNRPQSIFGFFSVFSNIQPCLGLEFDVYSKDKLIASSFVHCGDKSMAGNYCAYALEESARSLGTYTMLMELEYARRSGKDYYYPGFVYDLPSEFDYKLNFQNLEYFDWWGNWYPLERMNVRKWREHWAE